MLINDNIIRICLAIPSLGAGGMERVMSELILNFSKRNNVELHLLLFGKEREIFYNEIPNTIIIHKPHFKFKDNHRSWYTIKTAIFIRNEVKTINPDTILSFGNYWNSLVLLSCLGLNYPIYVSDRSNPDKDMGKVQNWLRRKLYPRAKGVIAQTKIAKEIYQKMYHHNNIEVIGNPIRKIDIPYNNVRENIVLSVGRLINTKHFDRLIRLFADIHNYDWKLVIVGGDSLKLHNSTKLQNLIDSMKINNRVFLAGLQKDVESYLLRSSIFVFPSSSEGFPNVIGEAMQAGLPVISYDCLAGPSEMIEEGKNGYLINVFDDKNFKDKLSKLMMDQSLRENMGEYAKCSIKRFDAETICDKFYNFILQ